MKFEHIYVKRRLFGISKFGINPMILHTRLNVLPVTALSVLLTTEGNGAVVKSSDNTSKHRSNPVIDLFIGCTNKTMTDELFSRSWCKHLLSPLLNFFLDILKFDKQIKFRNARIP